MASQSGQKETLLCIRDLTLTMGPEALLRGLSLDLAEGEMLGLVGESGCGKSLTALSIMRLLDEQRMRIAHGSIEFAGHDMLSLTDVQLESLRGREIAMIFQEPMTSLNPVFRIGQQLMEAVLLHHRMPKSEVKKQTLKLLSRVGIAAPESVHERYPHQFSGGQRQRIMIAMALACKPKLLIADEPTTALDVTVQAQILELLQELRHSMGMAVLLIAHDLAVVQQYCDRVAVMYCGQIVEQGKAQSLFGQPRHHYTHALLNTVPSANSPGTELPAIAGSVPLPDALPDGCAFAPRCHAAMSKCRLEPPRLEGVDHQIRCWSPLV